MNSSMFGLAIFNTLGHYIEQIPALIFFGLYIVITAVARFFIYLPEMLFRMVTGTGGEWSLNSISIGGDSGNDIAMAFIKSPQVRATFWTILGFSIVLLVVFTIIAIIRSEFTTDVSKAAKWPYIQRALKGLMNFVLVPVLSLVFIFGVNFLTRTINKVVGVSENNTMVRYVFSTILSGAERTDETGFTDYLINGSYSKILSKQEELDRVNYRVTENFYFLGYGDVDRQISPIETIPYDNNTRSALEKIYFVGFSNNIDDFFSVGNDNKVSLKIDSSKVNNECGTIYELPVNNTLSIYDYTKDDNVTYSAKIQYPYASDEYLSSTVSICLVADISHKYNIQSAFVKAYQQYRDDLLIVNNDNDQIPNIFEKCKDAENVEEAVNKVINDMMLQSTSEGINDWYSFRAITLGVPSNFTDFNNLDGDGVYVPYQCMIIRAPTEAEMKSVTKPYFCNRLVNFFYNPMHFNLILGGFAAFVIAWNLFGVVILLLKRGFELAILFMISPIAVALYPLDDGEATKGWRKSFQSRVLAPVAIVFSFNVFFTLMSLVTYNNVSFTTNIFGLGALFKLFWDLVIVSAMASLLKTASSMLCSIIGADDLLKDASATAGKGFSTVAKAAGTAAGVAIGVGGAAAGVAKLAGDKITKGSLDHKAKKDMAAYEKRAEERNERKSFLNSQASHYDDDINRYKEKLSVVNNDISDVMDTLGDPGASIRDKTNAQNKLRALKLKKGSLETLIDSEDSLKRKALSDIADIDAEAAEDTLEKVNRADSDRRAKHSKMYAREDARAAKKDAKKEAIKKNGRFSYYKKQAHDKAYNAFSYVSSYMPEDNAAVKWTDSMFGEEGRKKWYKSPAGFKAWKKADDKKKEEKKQQEAIEFEQNYKLKQQQAVEAKEKAVHDKAAIVFDMATKAGVLAQLDVINANIENAKTEIEKKNAQADYDDFAKRIGASQVLKDLNSKNSAIKDSATNKLKEASVNYDAASTQKAFEHSMEEMLPKLGDQLKNLDTSKFSADIANAIQKALNDIAAKTKGFKNYDPTTQALLKAIVECQNGLRDLNTLVETLKNLNTLPTS